MQSQISELSPVLVEIKVEIPWEQVQKDIDDSFGKLQRKARVRGFRPGKVPRSVVKQLFFEQVKSEVSTVLIEQGIISAVREHSLTPVAPAQIDSATFEEGRPLSFSAKLEVRPKIGDIETAGLEISAPPETVSDTDVDREVAVLREHHAIIRAVDPPRPANAGDILSVDYEVTINGEPRDDLSAKDRVMDLGSGNLIPELADGLGGISAGETREITVHFAADHGREDLRDKDAVFRVTVKEIKEKLLPDLDDEFAKDCGEYDSLADLRSKIRERLEEASKHKAASLLRERVMDALVAKNPVPVPPSLLARQEQAMMVEFATLLRMTGQDVPMSEELHSRMHERAEQKIRAVLLISELARRNRVAAEAEDVERKLAEVAQRTGKHVAKVRAEYQGEKLEMLESQIIEDKVVDYLLSQATISKSDVLAESNAEHVEKEAVNETNP